jgi:hypothetical protein
MSYLGIDSYIVPHYNLPLPEEASGSNFRPEKIFRLYRNGTMSYQGYGYGATMKNIQIDNIVPSERYLTRVYLHMVGEARRRAKHRAKFGGIPNLEHLILKFNGIDFIDGETVVA